MHGVGFAKGTPHRGPSLRLAAMLLLAVLAPPAALAGGLDGASLRAHVVARKLLQSGDLAGAQARWDSLLGDGAPTWAIALARPCGDALAPALEAHAELSPLWVAGPDAGCVTLLWGQFASEDDARAAAARVPPRFVEDSATVVRLAAPLSDLHAAGASVAVARGPLVARAPSPPEPPHTSPAHVAPVPLPPAAEEPQSAAPTTSLPPVRVPESSAVVTSELTAPFPADATAADLFARGNEAYAKGDLQVAIAAFEAATVKDPRNARTFNNLGTAWLMSHDPARAETAFRKSIALDPEYARAYLNLGTALYAQDRAAEAKPQLEHAVRLEPGNVDARSNLASLLVEQRDWDGARKVLRDALVVSPGEPRLTRQLAEVEDQLAVREPEPRRSSIPAGFESGGGPCAVGVGHARRSEMAARLFRDGSAAYERADYSSAEAALERALECDPTSASVLNRLGAARLSGGHAAEAAQAFRLALQLEPDGVEPAVNLALALLSQGQCGEAVSRLQELRSAQPASAEAAFQLGRMLYRCGRPTEAGAALDQAAALAPSDPRPRRLKERLDAESVTAP